jgi:choice-of-anchor C domain-containing protein
VDAGETSRTGWTVGGAGVDIVNNTLWSAHEGNDSIDLNALGAGSISQVMDTVPNQTYDVSFWMSGNPSTPLGPKTMNVSATGTAAQEFTFDTAAAQNTKTDMKYPQKTFTFAATGTSTTLNFASTTTSTVPGFAGPVIDDLVITAAPNVVKTKVWHTWTGGSVAAAPAPD